MRSVVGLLVALSMAVVASMVVMLVMPDTWKHRVAVAFTYSRQQPAKPPETKSPAPEPKTAHHAGKHMTVTVPLAETINPAVDRVERVSAAGFPFPADHDIQPGLQRAAVVEKFGPPGASVTLADGGWLLERFIYIDKPSSRRTFVVLVNGRVVDSQTILERF